MIGHSVRRREDAPLLTGHGQYAGDVSLPGMLHMAVVRSVYPHAHLSHVDLDVARKMTGVIGAYAARDLPALDARLGDPMPHGVHAAPRPVLARKTVRYVGEPIAVVLADAPARAADAAASVEVDYEPLAGAGDVASALGPGAPVLHDELASNVAGRVRRGFGDIAAAFAPDAVIVSEEFRFGRVIGGYMEPRATAATVDPTDGRLTVWTSTQGVYAVRNCIAAALDLDPHQVHVLAAHVGGSFGAKGQVYPEELLVPALARRLGRPVRWVATRTEDTQSTSHSHGDTAHAELAANPDGTLRGLRVRLQHDVGAYGASGLDQSDNILSHLVSAYRLPALDAESTLVYTNAVPAGFIRGGGREVGNFIIERMMDRLARELGVDPAEVRRRNLIQPGQMPHDPGYGPLRAGRSRVVYDGGDYARLLDGALDAAEYVEARQRQSAGAHIGIGVACCVEATGVQIPEPASIRIRCDGQVDVSLGSTPAGQGHDTTFAQVVAHHLGWPVDQVHVFVGDTDRVANAAGTAGSRSALEVGNAAAAVARRARRMLLDRAQAALEVGPDDIELGPAGATVRGAPSHSVNLQTLLNGGLETHDAFQSTGAYTAACHVAIVEVDPDTARLNVLRYAIAHDCGQPINPLLVDGQLHGGLLHGLGYALLEQAVYLPDGTLATANLADYALPGHGLPLGVPPRLVEVRSPVFGNNPEGFKGVGETGTIAAPAAIIGAVEDALRTFGLDPHLGELPLTPTRLFSTIPS